MILGIDVGGTHTDGVLIKDGELINKKKVLTDESHLLTSLSEAAAGALEGRDPKHLTRVVLSTTLSTNAIVQGKTSPVGLILGCGPGIQPNGSYPGAVVHYISGYINHRGIEVSRIDGSEVRRIAASLSNDGISDCAVVGKFSVRNPKHENEVKEVMGCDMRHVSLGHRMSGNLNFPRRVATAYLNASVWEINRRFVEQVSAFIQSQGITAPVYILKADGGTFDIRESAMLPAQTILSGPAASIMGVLSMISTEEDAVIVDIGGTTTDIALLCKGVPLLEPLGVSIGGHKTLVRGMRTRSIGVGGDSVVTIQKGILKVGPQREGVAAALGGPTATPTDAMVLLGLTDIGDRQKAGDAIGKVARGLSLSVRETARIIFEETCNSIAFNIRRAIQEVNDEPVYTIHEMLEDARLVPRRIYVVGGPAHCASGPLGELMQLPAHVPDHAEAANAVGAALARTTSEITLLADTEHGFLSVPEKGIHKAIPSNTTLKNVIETGEALMREDALGRGIELNDLEMETVEAQSFNMVNQFHTAGRNMRVKIQLKPGLIKTRVKKEQ